MEKTVHPNLNGVAETLLITLYIRALESQRPDALLKDEKAAALVNQMEYDFSHFAQLKMDDDDKVTIILRNREFDRHVRNFLACHPRATVVHIGCGLDSRFERVDNGRVEWYDLDLPEVIEVRRRLLGQPGPRQHTLAYSAFDPAWMEALNARADDPLLFLAEGVFMYFGEDQIRALVLGLRQRFPGAELVFDTLSPFMLRMNNLRMRYIKSSARYQWGLKNGKSLENWGEGITLLDEWHPFDQPEARLAHIQWMRHIPFLARVIGVFHYRLGKNSRYNFNKFYGTLHQ